MEMEYRILRRSGRDLESGKVYTLYVIQERPLQRTFNEGKGWRDSHYVKDGGVMKREYIDLEEARDIKKNLEEEVPAEMVIS